MCNENGSFSFSSFELLAQFMHNKKSCVKLERLILEVFVKQNPRCFSFAEIESSMPSQPAHELFHHLWALVDKKKLKASRKKHDGRIQNVWRILAFRGGEETAPAA